MSWLQDVKSKKGRALEKRKGSGFTCGYCLNSFEGDVEQLEDHQKVGKHEMCKGKEDKFDNELYLRRLGLKT